MTIPRLGSGTMAVAYLAAAAGLLAVAGSELAGPSSAERAAQVERRAVDELASLAETASSVAAARLREREDRARERRETLHAALAAAVGWAGDVASRPEATLAERFACSSGLEDLVPEGVAVGVYAPDGTPLVEWGGRPSSSDPDALGEVLASGLTVAVTWSTPEREAAESLRAALSAFARPGAGLYLVAPDGSIACEVSPRPVPDSPRGEPLRSGTSCSASGELRTGRLVTARAAVADSGWTAVAERFLPPDVLSEGRSRGLGTAALAGLGLVAAAAFAHVTSAARGRSSRSGGPGEGEIGAGAPRGLLLERTLAGERRGRTSDAGGIAAATGAADTAEIPFQFGRTIPRLRELWGASAEGPDLAACARSPILRALSRHVRSPGAVPLPREVRDWSRAA